MANVEDIYRKIRRGDTVGLKHVRPSEEDLAEGVERIRGRLTGTQRIIIPPRKPNQWLWGAPAAIAALAVLVLLFFPQQKPVPVFKGFSAGSTTTFGSVEVRVLTAVTLEHEFSRGKLSLRLWHGAIAVKRSNADTQLVIETPGGILQAQGTAFIIEHDKITSIEICEGSIAWQHDKQLQQLNASRPRLGADLSRLHGLLPAGYMKYPAAVKPAVRQANTGAFRRNDCVLYLADGSRRQGIVREVINGEYRLSHGGVDEPELFSAGDLMSCNRTRPVFGSGSSNAVAP